MNIVIAGHPLTGKTTLAEVMLSEVKDPENVTVRHTDETIDLGWSEGSQEVSTWFDAEGPWIIEGVSTPRALRKWLERNPAGKPCDRIIFLIAKGLEGLIKGQASMAKGCDTVMGKIQQALVERGVLITFEEISVPDLDPVEPPTDDG